jgi:hypothetical protein
MSGAEASGSMCKLGVGMNCDNCRHQNTDLCWTCENFECHELDGFTVNGETFNEVELDKSKVVLGTIGHHKNVTDLRHLPKQEYLAPKGIITIVEEAPVVQFDKLWDDLIDLPECCYHNPREERRQIKAYRAAKRRKG